MTGKKATPANGGRHAKKRTAGERGRDNFVPKGNERYDRHDTYYRKAKNEGFAARSIYKLEEIDAEYRIIKSGGAVLDLGCAPGSWLQYVEKKIGPKGRAVGIDLLPVKVGFGTQVRVLQGDAFEASLHALTDTPAADELRHFDTVLSDMAPNTTGIRTVDQARSMALCERALEVAQRALRPGGCFCVKVLEGGDMKSFVEACKELFEQVKIKRPKSTREGSTETFVIGLYRKGKPPLELPPSPTG